MYKEMIISFIILIIILLGNYITQNNTNKSVDILSNNLIVLREEINKETNKKTNGEKREEDITNQFNKISDIWKKEYIKMAYYIEHDELEKVETEITKIKSNIETEEYSNAIECIDSCNFILEHIKDKTALKIVNIF